MSQVTRSHKEQELWKSIRRKTDLVDDLEAWTALESCSAIEGYFANPTPKAFSDLCELAKKVWRKTPGRQVGSPSAPLRQHVQEDDLRRAETTARFYALLAARVPEVLALRERLPGHTTISTELATLGLAQVAPRHFDFEWFQKQRIPLFGHRSSYLRPDRKTPTPKESQARYIQVSASGVVKCVTYPKFGDASWDRGRLVRIPGDSIRCASDSVVDQLGRVSRHLGQRFNWHHAEALLFVLTGKTPSLPAISLEREHFLAHMGNTHHHPVVTLRIHPWTSPKSVALVYKQLQLMCCERQHRPLSASSLELFDFVLDYLTNNADISLPQLQAVMIRRADEDPIPWQDIAVGWHALKGRGSGSKLSAGKLKERFREIYSEIVFPRFVPIDVHTPHKEQVLGEAVADRIPWTARMRAKRLQEAKRR